MWALVILASLSAQSTLNTKEGVWQKTQYEFHSQKEAKDQIQTRTYFFIESYQVENEKLTCNEIFDDFSLNFFLKEEVRHLNYVSETSCFFRPSDEAMGALRFEVKLSIFASNRSHEEDMDNYMSAHQDQAFLNGRAHFRKLQSLDYRLHIRAGKTNTNDPLGEIVLVDDRKSETQIMVSFNETLRAIDEVESAMGFQYAKDFSQFMAQKFSPDMFDYYTDQVLPKSNTILGSYEIILKFEDGETSDYRYLFFPIRTCYKEPNGMCG